MNILLRFILIISILLQLTPSVIRGENNNSSSLELTWNTTGPFGGTVRSVAQDSKNPLRFFLGTADGQIYQSIDGAKNWTWIRSFIHKSYIIDNLLIDKQDSNIIYVAAWSLANDREGGVFKTIDGGISWKQLFNGHSVRALEVISTNIFIVGALDGIFRSIDGGVSWKLISPENHPELRNVESIAVDLKNSNIIYAGTWHLPWKTEDGGKNWYSIKGKISQIIDDSDIFSIKIDATNSNFIFCSACSGIYKSVDAGNNWTKLQGIPFTSRRTHIIFQHPVKREVLFAGTTEGLWRTTNLGITWQLITSKKTIINDIEINESQPNRIILATETTGILISEDDGSTFLPSNEGFGSVQISTVISDPFQESRLFASALYNGSVGGIYVSNDAGKTWQSSSIGIEGRDVYSMYAHPKISGRLYASTNYGVYISSNSGLQWTHLEIKNKGKKKLVLKNNLNKQNLFSSTDPKLENLTGYVMRTIIVGDGVETLFAASWDGLYRTSNAERGWEKILISDYQGRVFSLATINQEPKIVYAGTSNGLWRSDDLGDNWQKVEFNPDDKTFVQEIAVNPDNPNMILVGTRKALYISLNQGKSWERYGHGIPYGEITAIRFNPHNSNDILVGEAVDGGVYLSTNNGKNFRRIDINLPSDRVWSVEFDKFAHDRIYVGSFSASIFVGLLSSSPFTSASE